MNKNLIISATALLLPPIFLLIATHLDSENIFFIQILFLVFLSAFSFLAPALYFLIILVAIAIITVIVLGLLKVYKKQPMRPFFLFFFWLSISITITYAVSTAIII